MNYQVEEMIIKKSNGPFTTLYLPNRGIQIIGKNNVIYELSFILENENIKQIILEYIFNNLNYFSNEMAYTFYL